MPDLAGSLNAPKWVVLQLTEKCSLRCSMCYQWGQTGSYHGARPAQLDRGVLERVMADLAPFKPYFGLFGGEPLLYPDIDAVLRLARNAGSGIDIPTNGLLLDSSAEMLVEEGVRRLWISLDGPEKQNDAQRGPGVFRRVMNGIAKVLDVRTTRGRELPKVGVTLIVTPNNHDSIESFFSGLLSRVDLDHISIEFQNFITGSAHQQYAAVLREQFGMHGAPLAAGAIREPVFFEAIDCKELAGQIGAVQEMCEKRHIYFIAYPKTISAENYKAYFTGQWRQMADWKNKCAFPWLYAEISARGNVTSCHTWYDLPMGNVYQGSILDIWRSAAYEKYRKYLRGQLFPICTGCSRYYGDPKKR